MNIVQKELQEAELRKLIGKFVKDNKIVNEDGKISKNIKSKNVFFSGTITEKERDNEIKHKFGIKAQTYMYYEQIDTKVKHGYHGDSYFGSAPRNCFHVQMEIISDNHSHTPYFLIANPQERLPGQCITFYRYHLKLKEEFLMNELSSYERVIKFSEEDGNYTSTSDLINGWIYNFSDTII